MVDWIIGAKEFLTAIVALIGAVGIIYGWVVRPFKKQAELDRLQSSKIDEIVNKIDCLEKKVEANQAEYVRDRLQSLREKYCYELGWAQADEKRRICEWYEEYRKRGYNHLSETYTEDIMKLPERPIK